MFQTCMIFAWHVCERTISRCHQCIVHSRVRAQVAELALILDFLISAILRALETKKVLSEKSGLEEEEVDAVLPAVLSSLMVLVSVGARGFNDSPNHRAREHAAFPKLKERPWPCTTV